MQNKSRIASLNDKVGSVRNMISAFEQNNGNKSKNPVESLSENKDNDRIIIEGDSHGILEIQYVATNNNHNIAITKDEDKNNVDGIDIIESTDTINSIDHNNDISNVDSIDTFNNEESAKYDDQVNKLIEDYQTEATASSKLNISDITKDVSSCNSYIIKDFNETGVSQKTDNLEVNIHSSTVMFEKNDESSDNQTSSIYQTDSETKNNKVELNGENNNYSSETEESKSTWKDGELLIKKFGYNSTSTSNSTENSKTKNVINSLNDIYDNETLKCRDSIQSSPNSKKKVSIDWKFGDIDGLERISMKTASGSDHTNNTYNNSKSLTPSNIYYISNDNNIMEGTNVSLKDQHFPHNNNGRRRSVSFKEETPQSHYYSEKVGASKGNNKINSNLNPWKYVCYGILLAVIILFMISLIYKEIFSNSNPPIILTEYDIMDYFNKISNDTRAVLFDKLDKKFNMTITNNKVNRNGNAPEYLKNIYLRETDDDINVKYNYFENINPRFKYDAEIQNLMESNNLRFMFSGVAYAPENVIEPKCGAQLRNVMLDIARLSKITASVKTYGTQCKQSELILEAIQQLNLNMTLALGVWIGADDTINESQLNEMKRVVQKYPRKYFRSIFIGNEVLYRGDKSTTELISYINETKIFLKSINYDDLPVGTSEIGSMINEEMFKFCDFVGANIHPFFAGVEAQYGTRWLLNYYYNELVPIKQFTNSTVPLIISEVGWPYHGGKFGDSVAGSWEFQQFLNDWLCTTPADILNESFYFEAFDEPWKNIWWDSDRTWETEWGFFSKDRMMKNHIYIPDCSKYKTLSVDDFKLIKFEEPYADDENINID